MSTKRSPVTLVDIAREAGVSKSTVSLVLQDSALIRPQTAETVRQAMQRLGYVYNRGAANLRRARSNIVGVVVNDLTNPFFTELVVGIERVFRAAGHVSFIANTSDNAERQDEVLRAMREQGVAGIIASPARGSPVTAFDGFVKAGIPVIHAMRRLPGSRAVSVSPQNEEGAVAAVDHLIRLGHRRIAFLGGFADSSVQRDRVAGYRRALLEAGLNVDPALIIEGDLSRQGGSDCLDKALALADPPTAALCFNDVVAFGVLLNLRRAGRVAGRDFAVVGFDDVPEAALYTPALTTVKLDPQDLGERAAQSMLRMIEAGETEGENYTTGAELVVRESCGAASADRSQS